MINIFNEFIMIPKMSPLEIARPSTHSENWKVEEKNRAFILPFHYHLIW